MSGLAARCASLWVVCLQVALHEYLKIGAGVFSVGYSSSGEVELGESRVVSAAPGVKVGEGACVHTCAPVLWQLLDGNRTAITVFWPSCELITTLISSLIVTAFKCQVQYLYNTMLY